MIKSAIVTLFAVLLFGSPVDTVHGAGTVIPIPKRALYSVGVDYHATGTNFSETSFIKQYNNPQVRNLVKSQLQGMADAGVKIISTRLSFMDKPNRPYPTKFERLGFPPTDQQLANIRQYVQDVANIRTPDGGYLDLYLSPFTHGCSNLVDLYNCGYTWEQRIAIYKETYIKFFNAVGDIKRSDGSPAVTMAYMNGEIRLAPPVTGIPNTPRLDEFIKEMWPFFVTLAQSKHITPSLYFVVDHGRFYAAQSSPDTHLNWIKQGLSFLSDNSLPVPERLDFSFYVDPVNGEYAPVINHIMQDIKTAFPGKRVGIAETFHPRDPILRKKLGKAFIEASKRFGIPEEILFWTTPLGDPVAYPFDIASYFSTGDITRDGNVNIFDYAILAANIGRTGTNGFIPSDINKDGRVDVSDATLFKENYGK